MSQYEPTAAESMRKTRPRWHAEVTNDSVTADWLITGGSEDEEDDEDEHEDEGDKNEDDNEYENEDDGYSE